MTPERLAELESELLEFNHREYPDTYYRYARELLREVQRLRHEPSSESDTLP